MSKLKLGLCCISSILADKGIKYKTMTRKTALSLTDEAAQRKWSNIVDHNLSVLNSIVAHCINKGIAHYRLSASMFPLVTDPQCNFHITKEMCAKLRAIGDIGRKHGLTFSSHPSQYVVLASKTPAVVENAVADLELHAYIHDAMGLPRDHSNPINIHVGISSDSPQVLAQRFLKGLSRCSDSIVQRLVLENCDKGLWNCETLYDLFAGALPLTYDSLHDSVLPSPTTTDWMNKFAATWGAHTPIFHWSEGGANGKPRAHLDYFTHIPDFITNQFIWECEVKAKDKAILQII